MKTKVCVLISGKGTNLEAILKASEAKIVNFNVDLVLTDNPNAKGILYAKAYNIPFVCINWANKRQAEQKLIEVLQEKTISHVVLAGFRRVLSENVINVYPNKIINIHPSLLPKYPGLNVIEKAFKANEKQTGITIHYVDKGVDTGQIIQQYACPIDPLDTLETLEKRIQKLEYKHYAKTIDNWLKIEELS